MRKTLRAQSQRRSKLETLAAVKNPPVVFAKQADLASGPQQVNSAKTTPFFTTVEGYFGPAVELHDCGCGLVVQSCGTQTR